MIIQTSGILRAAMSEARARGECTLPWAEVEGYLNSLSVPNPVEASRRWADDNMMWAQFNYTDSAKTKIATVTFGSSK